MDSQQVLQIAEGAFYTSIHNAALPSIQAPSSRLVHQISKASEAAWIPVLLIVVSLLLLLLPKSKSSPLSSSGTIPLPHEAVQQILRAAVFSTLVVAHCNSKSIGLTVTVFAGYILALGIIRASLPAIFGRRSQLLHHVNVLLVALSVLLLAQNAPEILLLHSDTKTERCNAIATGLSWLSVLVSAMTPRCSVTLPDNSEEELSTKVEPSPEEACSYFSYYLSYNWLTGLIVKGSKRRLGISDLLPLPHYDNPLDWRNSMLVARKKYISTFRTLGYVLRGNIAAMATFASLTAIVEFSAPLGLYNLLQYLQNPQDAAIRPAVWVGVLFLGPILRSMCYQQYIFVSTRLIVRAKLCLVQELYSKALRCIDSQSDAPSSAAAEKQQPDQAKEDPLRASISNTTSTDSQSENVTNLVGYDVDAICNSRDFILVSIAAPLEIAIGVFFLYSLLGWSSMVGLGIMACSFPLAAILSKRMSRVQRALMRETDKRLSLVAECLSSARTIKYFAWEKIMARRVNAERAKEEKLIWRRNLYAVAVILLGDFIPLFALFCMFTSFTIGTGRPLTAALAFSALSVVETLRQQFVWVSNVTRFVAQATVAFRRIDRYIWGAPEVTKHSVGQPKINTAVFRRSLAPFGFTLQVPDVEFVEAGLNVVVGPSGSGKTTLILSLLGETYLESGAVTFPEDVAYAAQTPWILNDTIRNNITLHEPYIHSRYQKVVNACGLDQDFVTFARRDMTEVGANGGTLSGGQRQRIALARAIYSSASILVLDDVLSALDSRTSRHIWEHCLQSDLTAGRTIILVSQLQVVRDEADLVLEVSHGEVSVHHQQTKTSHKTKVAAATSIRNKPTPWPQSHSISTAPELNTDDAGQQKITQEIAGQGRNPRTLFYQYMLLFGGHKRAILAILLGFMTQIAFFSITLWLSVWVGAYSETQATHVGFYVAVYGGILASFSISAGLNNMSFQSGAWNAAHRMHKNLISSVLSVPISWYDQNPVGRVINRFSRDIFSLDSILVDYLRITIDNGFRLILRIGAIGTILPIFAVPASIICLVGVGCAELYTRTQLSVKALTSASQSPVFSLFVESLSGLGVIRSRQGDSDRFALSLASRLQTYARAAETQYNLNRWICVRADACAATIALATGWLAISHASGASAGLVGFSLTNAIGLSTTILTLVRNMNELEVELNCFHRAREYAQLPVEASLDAEDAEIQLPEAWPSKGEIEFRNVSASYTIDGPEILHNVSFKLAGGERAAIVGRTGSGKSSLAVSLLGFTKIISGAILVDGVDITKIPLQTLRRRLTFIPQEPVLLKGTVGYNLDPSQGFSTRQLSEAIDACSEISAFVSSCGPPDGSGENSEASGVSTQTTSGASSVYEVSSDQNPATTTTASATTGKSITLDTVVASQGENFSVGQRQILSLARAIARRSKVVILDEATASVDQATEGAIQTVLKSAFDGDTLLTVAHRLPTIVHYDKVIVMGSGEVQEFGSPRELWKNKDGIFHRLCRDSMTQARASEWTTERMEALQGTAS